MKTILALFVLTLSLNAFAHQVGDVISVSPTKLGEKPTLPPAPAGTMWLLVNTLEKAPPVYEYRLVAAAWSKNSPFPVGEFKGFVSVTLNGENVGEEDYSTVLTEVGDILAFESPTMATQDQYRFTSATQFETLNPQREVNGSGSCKVIANEPTVCEMKITTSFLSVDRLVVIFADGSMEIQDIIKTKDGQEQITFIYLQRQ